MEPLYNNNQKLPSSKNSPGGEFFAIALGIPVVLASFMMLQIEPIVGKALLPWFGGNGSVWIASMLFFQTALCIGYGTAALFGKSPLRTQLLLELALIGTSLFFLPALPSARLQHVLGSHPMLHVLAALAAAAGLPYIALSAATPLIQRWLHYAGSSDPFKYYALSNAASLLALITYPFIVEPLLPTRAQGAFWSALFIIFGCAVSFSAVLLWNKRQLPRADADDSPALAASSIPLRQMISWITLPAAGAMFMYATSNAIGQDVAAVPLLWVIPLSIYLLSFVLVFGRQNFYSISLFGYPYLALAVLAVLLVRSGALHSLVLQVALYSLLLFAAAMICHGELVKRKPQPDNLALFYFCIAVGGAAGGAAAAVIAPLIFRGIFELHVSVAVVLALALYAMFVPHGKFSAQKFFAEGGFFAAIIAVLACTLLTYDAQATLSGTLYSERNFYGVVRIVALPAAHPADRRIVMYNGHIEHGIEFTDASKRNIPTAYYATNSGAGLLIASLRAHKPQLRIGIVGLGAGTLAAYGQHGDTMRFYELNPAVISAAKRYFNFLPDSKAAVSIAPGDARLSLEAEAPQQYDLIVLDAFSGDAVPLHLLTSEAMQVYAKHLANSGAIAFHVTNKYLDLRPEAYALCRSLPLEAGYVHSAGDAALGSFTSDWVICAKPGLFAQQPLQSALTPYVFDSAHARLWTDDYSDLLSVIRR